jgi:hypothetical protein
MPKRFRYTEVTLANVTIHTNTNSSEAGHIADRPTVPVLWCHFFQVLSKIAWTPQTRQINSFARYKYGIFRYEHISTYTNRILDVYISMRICCMINKIIKIGGPRYLFDKLRFGQSSRSFNLLVPAHSLNARACSFFFKGIILWNDLPAAVKRGKSMGKFRLECL